MLDKNTIIEKLSTKYIGKNFSVFATIDSTNTFAKSLDAPNGTVIFAEEQTLGRGRMQRSWVAEKEKNLLFSIILYPEIEQTKIPLISFVASLAVAKAIRETTKLSTECKWPNDVLVNEKKVCGILLETVSSSKKIIVGIGVNVNQKNFSQELQQKATSLYNEVKSEIDRGMLLIKILENFEFWYEQLQKESSIIIDEWKKYSTMLGKKIIINEHHSSFEAIAVDIQNDGGLCIKTFSGEERVVYSGDVSVKL